jgi:ribosomal protein L32
LSTAKVIHSYITTCIRKRPFSKLSDAKAEARRLQRRSGRKVKTYRCPFKDNGGHWHVAHQ